MKNRCKAFIILIAILLLLTSMPVMIYANDGQFSCAEENVSIALQSPIVATDCTILDTQDVVDGVTELVSLRTRNVKHFRLEDGTYQMVVYPNAVHVQDDQGEWQDIDNHLSAKNKDGLERYVTENERVSFVKEYSQGCDIFTLSENGYLITMSMVAELSAAINSSDGDSISTKTKICPTIDNANKRDSARVYSNIQEAAHIDNETRIAYGNVLDAVDLEYVLTGNDIKENIIVKEPQNKYEYSFVLSVEGLIPVLTDEGEIKLCDETTNVSKYTIPAPFMYDSSGVASKAVSYQLHTMKKGQYILSIIADDAWINMNERVFPVVIDPSIQSDEFVNDTYINSLEPSVNYGDIAYTMVNIRRTTFIQNDIPALPQGASLASAYLCFYAYPMGKYSSGEITVATYQIEQPWDEYEVTYSSAPTMSNTILSTTTITIDESITEEQPALQAINVTTAVQNWYNGSANYGVAIKRTSGTLTLAIKSYDSGSNKYPYFLINYSYNVPDGVYALKNNNTPNYMAIENASPVEGNNLQKKNTAINPIESVDKAALFKISRYRNTSLYIIRSMVNNALSIGISGTEVVTKEIPCDDADVAVADKFYIEWNGEGFYLRPYNSSYVICVDNASNNLTVMNKSSATSRAYWNLCEYTGDVIEEVNWYKFDEYVMKYDNFDYDAYVQSSVIGENGPVIYNIVSSDNTTLDIATIDSATGELSALNTGTVYINTSWDGCSTTLRELITIYPAGCKPYNDISSEEDPEYAAMNCHGYALWSTENLYINQWSELSATALVQSTTSNELLPYVKNDFETNWLDVYIGSDYWEDVTDQGGIEAVLTENQWLVVMRIGLHVEYYNQVGIVFDYHFWYRTDTGVWVNKHGFNSYSQYLDSDLPTDDDSLGWDLGTIDRYYDSDLVYYRITERDD